MCPVTLQAPAKINIYLRLTGKRADGYNNLITVFQRLALADTLHFKKIRANTCIVSCDNPDIPLSKNNLINQAFSQMKDRYGLKGGLSVVLDKVIPIKAGLGGASSDAATTLIAINKLWQLKLKRRDLATVARRIGADVAFFVERKSRALGIERGDVLLPLRGNIAPLYVVLFAFHEGLSTKEVYQAFRYPLRPQMQLTKVMHEVIMLELFLSSGDVSAISRMIYNDLFQPACTLKPGILHLLQRIKKQGVEAVYMTGSGATLYALLRTRREAQQLARVFNAEAGVSTIVTRLR